MRVGDEEITFRRCARCEANAWEGEDGRLSLDRVLELAARVALNRPSRRKV